MPFLICTTLCQNGAIVNITLGLHMPDAPPPARTAPESLAAPLDSHA